MGELFHISEKILTLNGFEKTTWSDKNSPKDTVNTLKFEEFTKVLKENLKISVGYTYTTEDEKSFNLHSSSICLVSHEEYEVAIKVNDLADFLTLIRILKGDE